MFPHPARAATRLLLVAAVILVALLAIGTVEATRADPTTSGPTELAGQFVTEPDEALEAAGQRALLAVEALWSRAWGAIGFGPS